jgi:hypothetical protein
MNRQCRTKGETPMNRSTSCRKRNHNTAIAIFAFALSLGLIVSSHAQSYRSKGDRKKLGNMSQMTVSQMSITETTPSPQQKLHWLAEQALNWSGLPVVHVRPTLLFEGSLLILTSDSVRAYSWDRGRRSNTRSARGYVCEGAVYRGPARHAYSSDGGGISADCLVQAGTPYLGIKNMANVKFDRETTALLVIDPYNDFI